MYSRTLIAKVFFDTAFSHVDRQGFLLILHSRTLIAKFCFDTAFSHVSATESRVGGTSIESMGSLRGRAPHKLSGEGGSGGERAEALSPPVRTRPSFIYIHIFIYPYIHSSISIYPYPYQSISIHIHPYPSKSIRIHENQ